MYYDGIGARKNRIRARELFDRAGEYGDAQAQYNLGMMYYAGDGVPQDYSVAAQWLEKAALQGNLDARTRLNWMLRDML
jgi:hypothetical protein